jgi:hypothetical protein
LEPISVEKPFSCDTIGLLIVVRFRAEPTKAALEACQTEVLERCRETGLVGVLYDLRHMVTPQSKALSYQRTIDQRTGPTALNRAIVVPNVFMAHAARFAFGAGSCSIFYDDIGAARRSLLDPTSEQWSLAVREERRVRERRLAEGRGTSGRRCSERSAEEA